MIRKAFFLVGFILIVIAVGSLPAAGQNNVPEPRTYETGEFSELFLEGAFGVELIQGSSQGLEVHASDSRAFDYLKISKQGNLLHLHVDRKLFDFSRITLYLTFKDLERLRIYGGVRLETRGYLDLENLDMLVEGGARVKLKAKATQINLENKGGVLIELAGVADVLQMRMAGAGHINAGELKANNVDFRIDGVGTGKVFAVDNLNATIKGAGKIRYLGDPEITQSIDG